MRRHHHWSFKRIIRTGFLMVVVAATALSIVAFAKNIVTYPEEYSAIAANDLRVALNDGDTDAIERYRDLYISRDRYLFDGPMTIALMCDRYSLDEATIEKGFEESESGSLQDYFDTMVRPEIVVE